MTNKDTFIYKLTDRDFPDAFFERCELTQYSPSQHEIITTAKTFCFIIVKDGKGTITHKDLRHTLTKGNGYILGYGESARIKADSIEPFSLMLFYIAGNSAEALYIKAVKKEGCAKLNLGTSNMVCDSANDLIIECKKEQHTDLSLMQYFYSFLNNFNEHYSDKKIHSKNAYMTRAVEYIKQNYNKNISVENIANLLGIERSYLSRLFKAYKNKSTQNYIIDYRMYKAKQLFEEEDLNVSQVCAAVGYTNIYCFSRIFKSRVGMPPKDYMEKYRKKIM